MFWFQFHWQMGRENWGFFLFIRNNRNRSIFVNLSGSGYLGFSLLVVLFGLHLLAGYIFFFLFFFERIFLLSRVARFFVIGHCYDCLIHIPLWILFYVAVYMIDWDFIQVLLTRFRSLPPLFEDTPNAVQELMIASKVPDLKK